MYIKVHVSTFSALIYHPWVRAILSIISIVVLPISRFCSARMGQRRKNRGSWRSVSQKRHIRRRRFPDKAPLIDRFDFRVWSRQFALTSAIRAAEMTPSRRDHHRRLRSDFEYLARWPWHVAGGNSQFLDVVAFLFRRMAVSAAGNAFCIQWGRRRTRQANGDTLRLLHENASCRVSPHMQPPVPLSRSLSPSPLSLFLSLSLSLCLCIKRMYIRFRWRRVLAATRHPVITFIEV